MRGGPRGQGEAECCIDLKAHPEYILWWYNNCFIVVTCYLHGNKPVPSMHNYTVNCSIHSTCIGLFIRTPSMEEILRGLWKLIVTGVLRLKLGDLCPRGNIKQ